MLRASLQWRWTGTPAGHMSVTITSADKPNCRAPCRRHPPGRATATACSKPTKATRTAMDAFAPRMPDGVLGSSGLRCPIRTELPTNVRLPAATRNARPQSGTLTRVAVEPTVDRTFEGHAVCVGLQSRCLRACTDTRPEYRSGLAFADTRFRQIMIRRHAHQPCLLSCWLPRRASGASGLSAAPTRALTPSRSSAERSS